MNYSGDIKSYSLGLPKCDGGFLLWVDESCYKKILSGSAFDLSYLLIPQCMEWLDLYKVDFLFYTRMIPIRGDFGQISIPGLILEFRDQTQMMLFKLTFGGRA